MLRSFFYRTVTYLLQLLFQKSYFFRVKFLPSGHFLRISRHFLRIESSLGQFLFGTATFLVEDLFRIKISTEKLLFWSRYFCIASSFSEGQHFGKSQFFGKAIFCLTYLFWGATFQKILGCLIKFQFHY